MTALSKDKICLAHDHLDAALEHATDDTTRYHIRTALQVTEALREED